jgi:L-rhamnose isomerase
MVEPIGRLREAEASGDYTGRLALQEEIKSLPWGAVWDRYCATAGVAVGRQWIEDMKAYESAVLSMRTS